MSTREVVVLSFLLMSCSRVQLDASAPPSKPIPVAPSAAEVLDGLDQRKAVPLLPMMANHQKQSMREHLVAVQQIVNALANEDFAAVEQAAEKIGFSEQMGRMCTHMGSGAPGFAEQALGFHQTADHIAVAAREHDSKRVLRELSTTLQTCTSCHAEWKQQVVSDAQWHALTHLPE